MLRSSIPNRPVHEARGAKTASPLASATGLDQVHIAENGFLGENERGSGESIQIANQAAADSRFPRPGILHRFQMAAVVVNRREIVRQISALDGGQFAQSRRTIMGVRRAGLVV